ncbi:PP2C family protein-serine/threonine phosphatase [Streptomyces sioyaensis]|uniref:Stage II sporulation protein E n=2 Tax=Streptomyces sioyaensis TaxID=67364 RepID=A0A4Q1R075_9ACTN|nr:GAF domain-containing SpoIIE family protein phosphatase [Streptomyces sioyaensis]RXS68345.1 stage II sporulation protein E [Streptomyces sioyaensis]
MLGDLIAASHVVTLEQVPDMVAKHAARVGWQEVLIYLADLQQDVLCLLAGQESGAGGGAETVPDELRIEGTLAGRAFQTGSIVAGAASEGGLWWVPLLDGTERLGVLRAAAAPDTEWDAQSAQDLRNLAGLLALMVVSKRGTSDTYARLVRRRRMNVAAEMEWRVMPPRTFATGRVLISAVMEPAYEVSGDVFDYAVAHDIVHLALFDAMGHDTAAGLTANLALAASRNHRRQGSGILPTAEAVERILAEQFDTHRFATGVLAELNTETGVLIWTSLGHPPPVIIRNGRTALSLPCSPAPPMGTGLGLPPSLCRDQLEPGDRLLLYSDGITEARNSEGREFGLPSFTDFLIQHHADGLPVPETLRRLMRRHLSYHDGRLDDDATVLLLEWSGPDPYRPARVEALAGLPEHTTPATALPARWTEPGAEDT